METQIKKRIDWLDIAKGIAIICTIIGHSFGKNRIGVFIFSFHMPIFFNKAPFSLLKSDVKKKLSGELVTGELEGFGFW